MYIANMAAFLTHSVSADVLTMEAAVQKRLKICVYQALEAEFKAAWPGASFVFSSREHTGLFEDYDAGNCDLLAVPHTGLTPSIALDKGLCERGLVFTNSLVMENVSRCCLHQCSSHLVPPRTDFASWRCRVARGYSHTT